MWKEKENINIVNLEKWDMNMNAFTTTAFCWEGKKWQHLGLNVLNFSELEYTVKLNSVKWKTGFKKA